MTALPPRLRVGCAMWVHRAWEGPYLPEGLDRGDHLAAYASWCSAVEGNTTFYGVPTATTVRAWAAATPESFRFVLKLPRTITHDRHLRDVDDLLSGFLDRIAPLGERAETLSVQLPPSFGPGDLGALGRFLDAAPDSHRWAVEVRHPAFFADGGPARALERLLTDRGATWTSFDTTVLFADLPRTEAEREGWGKKPRLPRRTAAIGPEPVVRYIGRDDDEATVAGWQPWVDVVARWLGEGRRPTFFVHTPSNDHALGLARRFHDEVRGQVPDLEPLPAPVETHPARLF